MYLNRICLFQVCCHLECTFQHIPDDVLALLVDEVLTLPEVAGLVLALLDGLPLGNHYLLAIHNGLDCHIMLRI